MWAIDRIEVVDPCLDSISRSKHVTAVTELNLTTVFHHEAVLVRQRIRQHIHHVKFITNCRQNMEATWMERDRGSTLAWRCLPCQFERPVVPVPDADVAL